MRHSQRSTRALEPTRAAFPAELPAGSRVGDYLLEATLGRGGFGIVYRGRHVGSGRLAAVKTVVASSQFALESLRREIRAVSRLRHPGIVAIEAEGIDDGVPWYAMELVEGASMERRGDDATRTDVLAAPGGAHGRAALESAPLVATLTLFRRIAAALAYLHGEGLVHRDLKPANVMIRAAGDRLPVIMDLGLAAPLAAEGGGEWLDLAGAVSGTIAYMAPEQARGVMVDGRADLYALGIMLYEALAGELPFRGSAREVLAQHQRAPAPLPSRRRAGLPPELDALVARLLGKEPAERIAYAEDVEAELGRLGGAPPPAGWPPPRLTLNRPSLVGRQPARAFLAARLVAAASGSGGLAVVTGESGTGKTRLVMDVAVAAHARGFIVFASTCERHGAPLHGLARLMESLGDRCRELGEGETARLFGGDPSILTRYVPALHGLPGAAPPPGPHELPAARDVPRLLAAKVEEALRRLSEEAPALVVIDDVQWADEITLETLSRLAGSEGIARGRIALLALGRSEELPEPVARLAARASVAHRQLPRLEDGDVAGMVAEILGLDPAPPELCARVVRAAEGNPFYVCEYLRAAVAIGQLARSEGRWHVAAGEGALPLPASVRALVVRHLDALDARARAVLEVAAVLGPHASTELLLSVAALPGGEMLDALHDLVRRQILEQAAEGLRISHDKLREAAYGEIPAERRMRLHACAADALAAALPEESWPLSALARHRELGGDAARARPLYLRACQQARVRYMPEEAEAMAERVLALGGEPDETVATARFILGDLMVKRGALVAGRDEMEKALSQARELGVRELQAKGLIALAERLHLEGRNPEAHALLDECLALARSLGWGQVEGKAWATRSNFAWDDGRREEALELSKVALALFERAGAAVDVVRCHASQSTFLLYMERTSEAREIAERGAALAGDDMPLLRARLLLTLAMIDLDLGDVRAVVPLLEEGIRLAVRCHDRWQETEIRSNLGAALLLLGEPEAARRELVAAERAARSLGSRWTVLYCETHLADERRLSGDGAASRELALAALAGAREVGAAAAHDHCHAEITLGWLARDDGEIAEARAAGERALALATDPAQVSSCCELLATVARLEGRTEEALELALRATGSAGRARHPRFFGHVAALLALHAAGRPFDLHLAQIRRLAADLPPGRRGTIGIALAEIEAVLGAAESGERVVRGVALSLAPPGLRAHLLSLP